MIWRFLNTGFNSGSFNMTLDEELAREAQDENSLPTLRLYGWTPSALSIGMHQNFEEFDLKKLRETGIDIVKRPTGGKAILHAHELTYSIAIRTEEQTPKEIYRRIHEGLLRGVRDLGIQAELTRTDDNFRQIYQEPYAVSCFTSSAKYEIQAGGKKLIGSAQRRYGSTILQHGSLLLGPQHRSIIEYLSPSIQHAKSTIEEHFLTRTTDAETLLNRAVTFEEAASAIKQGFETALGISFIEAEQHVPALA